MSRENSACRISTKTNMNQDEDERSMSAKGEGAVKKAEPH